MERPHFDIAASGKRMKAIRQMRHISVKEVMEYMGFESTQAVYKWEAGKCFPQADNLIALAFLYRVSPTELLVEEDQASSFLVYLSDMTTKTEKRFLVCKRIRKVVKHYEILHFRPAFFS